jgi:hypothetical protein
MRNIYGKPNILSYYRVAESIGCRMSWTLMESKSKNYKKKVHRKASNKIKGCSGKICNNDDRCYIFFHCSYTFSWIIG